MKQAPQSTRNDPGEGRIQSLSRLPSAATLHPTPKSRLISQRTSSDDARMV
jgi:hypothetical protein